jgi:hypothetical protein
VPLLLLLGPPFILIFLFLSATLLTEMTGISLHMQWTLTSQSLGSFLKENNCFVFPLQIKLHNASWMSKERGQG